VLVSSLLEILVVLLLEVRLRVPFTIHHVPSGFVEIDKED